MSTLPASNIPPIDQALVPASVRGGDQAAQQAYQTGLAFEQILVQQLSKELADSATPADGSDSGAGLFGSDPANTMFAQMLPTALTSGVMSAGGMGIAQQLALALDPTLLSAGVAAGGSSSGSSTATSTTGGVAPSPAGGAA